MTENSSNGLIMPVSPMYSGMGNCGFGNGFGGDWAWIILLLLLAGNGGWGGGFGGFGGGFEFPWLLNGQQGINTNTNNGFQNALLNDNITSVRDGIANLSTQLCNCCSDMRDTVSQGFFSAEVADNGRQMANMQQAFASQTAMAQGFSNLSSQFADCCCENRLAVANLGADIAREACADRQAVNDGVRDILANQTAGVQRILDQMCNDKIDAKNERIADLERQLTMANFAASQTAQTARLEKSNNATVDALYDRLATCPVGTMPVYGNQPIFTCPTNNNGCGCGNY